MAGKCAVLAMRMRNNNPGKELMIGFICLARDKDGRYSFSRAGLRWNKRKLIFTHRQGHEESRTFAKFTFDTDMTSNTGCGVMDDT